MKGMSCTMLITYEGAVVVGWLFKPFFLESLQGQFYYTTIIHSAIDNNKGSAANTIRDHLMRTSNNEAGTDYS